MQRSCRCGSVVGVGLLTLLVWLARQHVSIGRCPWQHVARVTRDTPLCVCPLTQGRLEAAEQQLQRWRLILDGAADCATPEDVLHLLNRLQQQHVQAAVQVGDKAEEAAQLRSQVEAAAAAQREAEADAAAARAAAEESAAGLSRAERKLALLGKERDGLKAILASYDEEYLNQHGGWQAGQQVVGS